MWTKLSGRENRLIPVPLDELVHDLDQGVELLGNFQDRLRVITQNARLIALHPRLIALDVHDLDDSLFDMFEPLFGSHPVRPS